MAVKHLIGRRGIGFSPGSVKYVVTLGLETNVIEGGGQQTSISLIGRSRQSESVIGRARQSQSILGHASQSNSIRST